MYDVEDRLTIFRQDPIRKTGPIKEEIKSSGRDLGDLMQSEDEPSSPGLNSGPSLQH